MYMSLSKLQELEKGRTCCSPWGRKELDMIEQLNNNYSDAKNRIKKKNSAKNENSRSIYLIYIDTKLFSKILAN